MMTRSVLGGLLGGLLKSNPSNIPPPSVPHSNAQPNIPHKLHDVIANLDHCDVKIKGMCCYFPEFCDPLAQCLSDPNPGNVFEIAQTFPKCLCTDGFEGDGKTRGTGCQNVDECARGTARCEHDCVDLIPGYQCKCKPGYRLNNDGRTCSDIDECAERQHNCAQICKNTIGSFICSCRNGYKVDPDDPAACVDVDECEEARFTGYSVCQYDDLCVNLKGTYHCGCPSGLQASAEDSRRCEDIDECSTLAMPCPNGRIRFDNGTSSVMVFSQVCENVFGGYHCSCLSGTKQKESNIARLPAISPRDELLLTSSEISVRYNLAQEIAANIHCEDINECESSTVCPASQTCVNDFRTYRCDCGVPGLEFDPAIGACVDMDECAMNICGTDPHMRCENLDPGFKCQCEAGWQRAEHSPDWDQKCIDVDECALSVLPVCPNNSLCVNEPGSYKCTCHDGYQWQGSACVDVNECALEYCGSPCLNLAGSFVCACDTGTTALGPSVLTVSKETQANWQRLESDFASRASAATAFPAALAGHVACEAIDICSLTEGMVCGLGYDCRRNGLHGFECICPNGYQEDLYLLSEHQDVILTISENVAYHLKHLPTDLLSSIDPNVLLVALTSLPFPSPAWSLLNIDWTKSQRLKVPSKSRLLPNTLNDIVSFLASFYGDLLLDTHIRVCIQPEDACAKARCRSSAPCCRPRGASTYDCLPLKWSIGHRQPLCPPDSSLPGNR